MKTLIKTFLAATIAFAPFSSNADVLFRQCEQNPDSTSMTINGGIVEKDGIIFNHGVKNLKPKYVYLNSYGGNLNAAMRMTAPFFMASSVETIIVPTTCLSACAYFLLTIKELNVKVKINENADIRIHFPRYDQKMKDQLMKMQPPLRAVLTNAGYAHSFKVLKSWENTFNIEKGFIENLRDNYSGHNFLSLSKEYLIENGYFSEENFYDIPKEDYFNKESEVIKDLYECRSPTFEKE